MFSSAPLQKTIYINDNRYTMDTMKKNAVLTTLAKLLVGNIPAIFEANQKDIETCDDIDESMFDRLKIDENKIPGMIASINETIKLEDPEGKILYEYNHTNGIKIKNKSVPFGKILIIYESRPDVTIEASILAFKAGNKVLLKGGKESKETNKILVDLWHQALSENGEDKDYIIYLDVDREQIQEIIKNNTHNVDLIIPRGGESLINFVKNNTDIPIIVSGRGNNFVYIDEESDFEMAIKIVIDGKSRISVCNALDKVLVNENIPNLKEKISQLVNELGKHKIEVLGDKPVYDKDNRINLVQDKDILAKEFLASKIFLSTVKNNDEAIQLINKYSGGHSAAIISSNKKNVENFQNKVDCAAVHHNSSIRFTDGSQFGFGAEIATSTQKLHFRGPIGINQLVTNKWFISGNGQTRN